jgi:hypothetical protein
MGIDQEGVLDLDVDHEEPSDGGRPIREPDIRHRQGELMSTHASVLVDSVGPPSAEVCKTAASFP